MDYEEVLLPKQDLTVLKPGDKITRLISTARVPMEMTVFKVKDGVITMEGGWTFDLKTGIEIDELLGWGPDTVCVSWLDLTYKEETADGDPAS